MDDRPLGFDTKSDHSSAQGSPTVEERSHMVVKTEEDVPEFPMLVFHPEVSRGRAPTENEQVSQLTWNEKE